MVHDGDDLSQLLTINTIAIQNSTLIRLTNEKVGLFREQTCQNKAAQDKWSCGQEDWNRRQQGWNSKTETCIKNLQDKLVGVEGQLQHLAHTVEKGRAETQDKLVVVEDQLQHLARTVEKGRAETDSKLDTMKKELDLHRWVLVNLSVFVSTVVIVGILWIAKDDSGQT